ncbi:ferrous iron transporter B [Atopobacter phocae]|uniref:ferrous iron transporter B n=1 Tax=Atopobacter phocae TaxID=136492 RepID=UPI000471D84E|nr:ferrous iron transporter B [Atopobacter phocae]
MEEAITMEQLNIKKKSDQDIVVSLAGNPNVGKSTIFNSLTGLRQHTGNWPGKTVGLAQGESYFNDQRIVFVDLPGTYSLMARSQEEVIARDFIQSQLSDVTVVVCDATSLERNLNLVLQILQLTPKVIVCVNLLDEAKRKKIQVDLDKLSYLLGVPVIGTSATYEKGLDDLQQAIKDVYEGHAFYNPLVREHLLEMVNQLDESDLVEAFINRASVTANDVTTYEDINYDVRDRKIDRLLTGKVSGIIIMLLFLFGIFWFTIEGADYPSELLSKGLFWIHDEWLKLAQSWNWPMWLQGLLIEGVYKVVAWVIAVMLPPMAIFFPLFTLLEDLGYLPRIAFNLDHVFQKAGACGKQALSMCMGFGCNAAGVVGARIIDSPRERIIAILTNNLVPCNGRFPILISVIMIFFVGKGGGFLNSIQSALFLTGSILLGVMMTFVVSRVLSNTLLKGLPSSFTLELPPYRKPRFGQVLVRSVLDRTIFVLARAIKVSAPVGVLIWVLANWKLGDISLLTHFTNFLDPFAQLMGLDGIILMAFIIGLPANEIVIPCMLMGYLATNTIVDFDTIDQLRELLLVNGWTALTALNVLLFTLFHWPCGTTLLTIHNETKSWKWTWHSFWIPTALGIGMTMFTTAIAHLLAWG